MGGGNAVNQDDAEVTGRNWIREIMVRGHPRLWEMWSGNLGEIWLERKIWKLLGSSKQPWGVEENAYSNARRKGTAELTAANIGAAIRLGKDTWVFCGSRGHHKGSEA